MTSKRGEAPRTNGWSPVSQFHHVLGSSIPLFGEPLACQQPFNTPAKFPTYAKQDLRPTLHLAVFPLWRESSADSDFRYPSSLPVTATESSARTLVLSTSLLQARSNPRSDEITGEQQEHLYLPGPGVVSLAQFGDASRRRKRRTVTVREPNRHGFYLRLEEVRLPRARYC